jgi:hypothetical protein
MVACSLMLGAVGSGLSLMPDLVLTSFVEDDSKAQVPLTHITLTPNPHHPNP